MKATLKTWLLNLLALILAFGVIELGAFVFFQVLGDRFTFYDLSKYVVKPEELERMERAYDRELGWVHRFETPFGERPRSVDYGRPLIATFGDSFTYCGEVGHTQTFQTYLAELVRGDVYNFGVSAYGTDQAYLRFRRDYPKVKTPIVVLGFITENINRTVNVYRRFYYPRTGGPFTKPRFILQQGGRELLKNPIERKKDLVKLMDAGYLPQLARNDYWFNRSSYPLKEFPYSAILLNQRMWLELLYGQSDRAVNDVDPRPWEDLWDEESARTLFFSILDSFVVDAKRFGAVPILMVFPRLHEMKKILREQTYPESASMFLEYCRSKDLDCFDGISALSAGVNSLGELKGIIGGHLRPPGNRLLAQELSRYLDELGVLDSR